MPWFRLFNGSTDFRPYKVYSALITQSGTAAPTVTVLENAIGAIVWTRTSTGEYAGTLAGAFTASKTFVSLTLNYAGTSVTGYSVSPNNNYVSIQTLNSANTAVDSKLVSASLEIRVYN